MKTDKTQLIQDIEAIKKKLASMEQELNKPDEIKHFPSKGDTYYVYEPVGLISCLSSDDNNVRPNAYKTKEEAQKAYNKAVALEKVKRRLIELQGDWKPDWKDFNNKHIIYYNYIKNKFDYSIYNSIKYSLLIPYIKTMEIAETIIDEMDKELRIIFEVA